MFYSGVQNGGAKIWRRCKKCSVAKKNVRIMSLSVEERRKLWRERSARSMARHPERYKARALAAKAVRYGTLIKPLDCEKSKISSACFGRLHAHHDDYTKPLEVRWLCHRHHREQHYPLSYKSLTPPTPEE